MARDWRLAVLAAFFLASCGLLLAPGLPEDLASVAFYAFVLLLMIAPILPLCLWPAHAEVNGAAAILIGGAGLLMIIDALYFQPLDPQSAFVFLFVPVMQLMAVGVFAMVLAAVLALARR